MPPSRYFPAVLLTLVALVTIRGTGSVAQEPPSRAERDVKLLVPAYFYPAGKGLADWQRLIDSSGSASIVAIVNPDSGPGKRVDDNYQKLFDAARGKPIRLIGYVTLSYAQRPISAIKADIDSWLYFYPEVQGIFFDEQPSGADQALFAVECFAYARQRIRQATVVTNPGVVCAKEYLAGHDGPTACLFEHHTGFDKYRLPAWADELPSDRFAVLLYELKTAKEMRSALQRAVEQRAGYVYFTDHAGSMPWGGLPGYWEDELKAVSDLP